MPKLVVVLLITLFLNHVTHASPIHSQEFQDNETEESSEVSATGNDDVDETEYPPGLVEEIKSRILKSLHKTKAPKNHVPLPDLQRLNFRNILEENGTISETNISTSGKTKTDFLPAYVDNICNDDSGFPCVKFHFNVSPQDNFRSAELWLYKKENVTEFSITHSLTFNRTEENDSSTTYVYNQTSSKSWVRFDVSRMISSVNMTTLEFLTAAQNSEIAIETEGDKKPFLVMHTFSDLRSVSKRSSPYCSNDSSTCCKQRYFIRFKDVKWDTWIVEPEGYEANYCNGTCTVNQTTSHHARVFMALCENNPQKFKHTGKMECLTCAPTAYRPISVIYLDEDGIQVVNHLPGMSVTDCGCV